VGSTESFLSKAFEKLKDIQVGVFCFLLFPLGIMKGKYV
jgi:hypothetical protein